VQEKKPGRWTKAKFKVSLCVPLIAFGDGMKNSDTNKIKDHVSGTTAILQRELKLRSKSFKSVIVDIGEFKTSKICSRCKEMNLKPTKLPNGNYTKSILDCKNCHILWNRDVNASKNMLDISQEDRLFSEEQSP
jgi:hypothetical protein